MTTEIRPITAAEAEEYVRALPYVNGLPQEEPEPSAGYAGFATWPPQRTSVTDEDAARYAAETQSDWFRPQAAFVDGRIAGASAIVSVELTVPAGRQVRMGGVTSTGVLPTYRRRGLLRAIMTAMLSDCRERGEFVAGLSASEATIYGRYGFGPATFQQRWEARRSDVAWLEPVEDTGTLELVEAPEAAAAWASLHDQVRAARVGEISALPGHWDGFGTGVPADGSGPARHLLHRGPSGVVDGAAVFRLPWSVDPALAGALQVEAFEALDLNAYRALWSLLADFDLTNRVVAARRPVEEPLRWMLTNSRALKVTRTRDNLWLRILDVAAALEARTYSAEGSLVLEIADDQLCPWNTGRWRLTAGTDGVTCTPAGTATADLRLTINALGSFYLGGVTPGTLLAAGRLIEERPGAVKLLGALLRQDPAPHNALGF